MDRLASRAATVAAVIALSITSAPARAATTGTIKGRVTDQATGKPLTGVSVVVKGPQDEQTEFTDASGNYTITDLLPGEYLVTFRFANVKVERTNVLVEADKTIAVNGAIPTGKVQTQT